MSKEQVKAFIKELHNDKSLKSELESTLDLNDEAAIESEEEADAVIDRIVGFAANNDYEFSGKEYKSVIVELNNKNKELSNDQLDEVSGGGFGKTSGDYGSWNSDFTLTPEMKPIIPGKDNNDEVSPEFL